eukprot:CAMPEP_0194330986 /NCGR_PEP_ID=MMETSP0171-20130528/53956_1 /TAXON_ID=218684 /ORGANISM="Corethron pennatum, Strain L29A3" /LENGTH=382 /DNA_ID=CAMNT_0039092273 /DNA_START=1 /DNA_END=1146 /DNA_ORIENTATION=+
MLKNLPKKLRERAFIKIEDAQVRKSIADKMVRLRSSKGALGKLAVQKWAADRQKKGEDGDDGPADEQPHAPSPGTAVEERRGLLNDLYRETGRAKIPVVLSMLARWVADPSAGKLCVFAHHLDVLDALEKLLKTSKKKQNYVRIDGKTAPNTRQKHIDAFQEDPALRVAVLGLTAAGVGVTLTASSTVWFVELYWTPAVVLQAEDRCHRIGQQSTVKCTYLIGKHTLDELLWALMEKKVKSLGEMVEGKNIKIVLHQDGRVVGEGGKYMFDGGEGEEKGAEGEGGDDDSLSEGLLDLADDPLLRNDLTELARQGKGKGDNDGEGEGEGDVADDTKWSGIAGKEVEASAGPEDSTSATVVQGVSEDSAIVMLSDDDDDDDDDE